MNSDRLDQILSVAADKRYLVVGDLMLDEFVWGNVGRISPEAPVPVVEVTGESFYPGGAANVARNLREFARSVAVIGGIGKDRTGAQLRELLVGEKIDVAGLITTPNVSTTLKTRIIARHQQVVRVDRERIGPPEPQQIRDVIDHVSKSLPLIDAIIFEDYGKGFLAEELVRELCDIARAAGKITVADPNPRHPIAWRGLSAVKPNRSEAFQAAGVSFHDSHSPAESDADLARVGETLLDRWETKLVLITLGEQGMMLFQRGEKAHHVPTKARQVFDVSGAGDTAIALFTVALTAGATPIEAAEIANHASAVVVGKLGTATASRDELRQSFENG